MEHKHQHHWLRIGENGTTECVICARYKGAHDERERIIALTYQALAYYNSQLQSPKSLAFARNMENRKKGIMEAIKLMRMTNLEASDQFKKKGM
jgi:hypothetical protein